MKKVHYSLLLALVLSLFGTQAFAYDIAVKNADGVTIYYNYINNGTELSVTNGGYYSGSVNIPEDVTYMSRTRKVTSIGSGAFQYCSDLTSVIIPVSVTTIGERAFNYCESLTSIIIPNSVKSIGNNAFEYCTKLTSVNFGSSVSAIGDMAFCNCSRISSIEIPNSVTSIGYSAFQGCYALTSAILSEGVKSIGYSAFQDCSRLASITIPNSVTSIGNRAFENCGSLTSVTIGSNITAIEYRTFYSCNKLSSIVIPSSVANIGEQAFYYCSGLTSLMISEGVTSIKESAFVGCSGLTSVTIPSSVTSIGKNAFSGWDLPVVISKIENPFTINTNTFSDNTFFNATLYVPTGTIENYKATEGWKKFSYIEEGNGGNTPEPQKCDKPTISYSNGKLTFSCSTEGATCQSTITDTDIASYSSNEIQLGVTYSISVYATKAGYENSDVATATLCWIDVESKTEGIENSVAQVRANAVLIQTEDGRITVNGANDGTVIGVYNTSGVLSGTEVSRNGSAVISTSLQAGSVAIVKIGDKSVKVIVR